MPTYRMVPTSDDSPNTFTPALPHFSRVDEDIDTPNTGDFIRANIPGMVDRFGFGPAPTGLTECQTITVRIHHGMFHGQAGDGTMSFPLRVYAGGALVASTTINVLNDSTNETVAFGFAGLTLTKTQIESLQVEFDSTTTEDPVNDWLGISPRWTIYTVNVDITYTETEKTLDPIWFIAHPYSLVSGGGSYTVSGAASLIDAIRQPILYNQSDIDLSGFTAYFVDKPPQSANDDSYVQRLRTDPSTIECTLDPIPIPGGTIISIRLIITHEAHAIEPGPPNPYFWSMEFGDDITLPITIISSDTGVPGGVPGGSSQTGSVFLFAELDGQDLPVDLFNLEHFHFAVGQTFPGGPEVQHRTWSIQVELLVVNGPVLQGEKEISSVASNEKVIIPTVP